MYCNRASADGWEKFTFGITSAPTSATASTSATPVASLSGDETELRYFPNPVSSTLTYQLPSGTGKHKIQVMDLSGKVVLSTPLVETSTENYIDMSGFSTGLYLIQISEKGFTKSFRIHRK
jgi:hypothetical protein